MMKSHLGPLSNVSIAGMKGPPHPLTCGRKKHAHKSNSPTNVILLGVLRLHSLAFLDVPDSLIAELISHVLTGSRPSILRDPSCRDQGRSAYPSISLLSEPADFPTVSQPARSPFSLIAMYVIRVSRISTAICQHVIRRIPAAYAPLPACYLPACPRIRSRFPQLPGTQTYMLLRGVYRAKGDIYSDHNGRHGTGPIFSAGFLPLRI